MRPFSCPHWISDFFIEIESGMVPDHSARTKFRKFDDEIFSTWVPPRDMKKITFFQNQLKPYALVESMMLINKITIRAYQTGLLR